MRNAALIFALTLAACENKYEKMAQEAGPPPSASIPLPVVSAAPSSAAALPAPKKKREFKCDAAATTVDFHGDTALEAEVRLKLAKQPSDMAPIKKTELAAVKSINLTKNGHQVDDLDPCVMPLFTGLKDLFLGSGELEDLTPIQTLTSLVSLRASGTHVKDLKPVTHLGQLDRLDLSKTPIVDIDPLKGLAVLTELQLDDTHVEDLTPLSNLKKLEKVHLRNTPVKSIAALKDIKTLKLLEIQGTPCTDTSPLSPLVAKGLKISMGLGDNP